MRKKVVVLGVNIAGLTAALSVKHELHGDVDVTVIAPTIQFLFTPSLIWLPFGRRERDAITFLVTPTLDARQIEFVEAAASDVDPIGHTVTTSDGSAYPYDYLVVATGSRNQDDVVPGFLDHACTITTLDRAEDAGRAWRRLLRDPGDVVVAATQGAVCFGAAYEFLFNAGHQLRKAGLRKHVRLTYVTSEPFLGHLGVGGLPHGERLLSLLLSKEGIDCRTGASIDHVDDGCVELGSGERIPFSFGMVVPPFLGQEFLNGVDGLADEKGFIPVRATYQSERFPDVYAVGVAAAVEAPWQTPTPVGGPRTGVPKTGFPTVQTAQVAARNIAAQVRGEAPHQERPFEQMPAVCVMDAGNHGVIVVADKLLPPREHGVLIPGPQAHLMKLGVEQYFLWKMRHGYVQLP